MEDRKTGINLVVLRRRRHSTLFAFGSHYPGMSRLCEYTTIRCFVALSPFYRRRYKLWTNLLVIRHRMSRDGNSHLDTVYRNNPDGRVPELNPGISPPTLQID